MQFCLFFVLFCIVTFETSNGIDSINLNLRCMETKRHEAGKYVGCYQDHGERRMFLGYVTRFYSNSNEKCVEICQNGGFVYAGMSE